MANYQPWYVGMTATTLQIPLMVGSNADDITSLSASNFSYTFQPTNGISDTTGTGTLTIITSNPAVISIKFSPADVAQTFSGNIFVKAMGAPSFTNADELVWDPIPFQILAS